MEEITRFEGHQHIYGIGLMDICKKNFKQKNKYKEKYGTE